MAFEEIVRTDGWKILKNYFEAKVKAFATSLLVTDKDIKEFEKERYELVGLRKMFGFVDSDIKALEDANKNTGTSEDKR